MSSLNKAQIIGRLGKDVELRYTSSNTPVATLSVATSEKWTDKNGQKQELTEWHRITAWGRLAEICNEYLKKGSLAYFEGPIQTREWEDKDGQKRYTTEIKALTMTMLDSKGNSQGSLDSSGANNARTTSQDASSAHDAMDFDDLPFSWLLMIGGAGLMQVVINAGMV